MATAAYVITQAMRLFGILDQTESPEPEDLANNVPILNDLLRAEQADGAVQFLMKRVTVQLPAGAAGQVYSFSVGTADTGYLVQVDAVAVKSIWMNDVNLTVNRMTRGPLPSTDVVRTTYPGLITKWHSERQIDGSVLITAWPPPRATAQALIEYGGRIPALTAVDGSDTVSLPPEGISDAVLLLGRRICSSYGRDLNAVGIIAQDAEAVNVRWRQWARGQQWLRLVRS